MSGPNDFHLETINGTVIVLPGLGSYEPVVDDTNTRAEIAVQTQALDAERLIVQQQAAAVSAAEAELDAERLLIAEKQAELDALIDQAKKTRKG